MDKLYEGELLELKSYGSRVDELKKFLNYVPKFEIEIQC